MPEPYEKGAMTGTPDDLDFTSMLDPGAPAMQPAPRTPQVESEATIGAGHLKRDGFHVVVARRRQGAPGAAGRVLIVEDDDDTASLAARALQKGGFATSRAVSAKETAHLLATLGLPALILLDVELPGLNGFEMLARLRAHPKLRRIPIVMFTARSSSEDVVRGLTLGADGYVAKPVSPARLLEAVAMVLGR